MAAFITKRWSLLRRDVFIPQVFCNSNQRIANSLLNNVRSLTTSSRCCCDKAEGGSRKGAKQPCNEVKVEFDKDISVEIKRKFIYEKCAKFGVVRQLTFRKNYAVIKYKTDQMAERAVKGIHSYQFNDISVTARLVNMPEIMQLMPERKKEAEEKGRSSEKSATPTEYTTIGSKISKSMKSVDRSPISKTTRSTSTAEPVDHSATSTSEPVDHSATSTSEPVDHSATRTAEPVDHSATRTAEPMDHSAISTSKPIYQSSQSNARPTESSAMKTARPAGYSTRNTAGSGDYSTRVTARPGDYSTRDTARSGNYLTRDTGRSGNYSTRDTGRSADPWNPSARSKLTSSGLNSSRDWQRRPQSDKYSSSELESTKDSLERDLFQKPPLRLFTKEDVDHSDRNKIEDNHYRSLWDKVDAEERSRQEKAYMRNGFDEMIQLTKEGKLWRFPIDNEQDLKESEVPFHKHVFLDHLLEEFPKKGPIRHFMHLVVTGLSKNPYLTVEQKEEHIQWYKNYFRTKEDVLVDLLGEAGKIDGDFSPKAESQQEGSSV